MRILHISYCMSIGGAERALFQLMRGQKLHGVEPELLVITQGGYYADRTREIDIPVYELMQSSSADRSIKSKFAEIAKGFDIFPAPAPELPCRQRWLAGLKCGHGSLHMAGQHSVSRSRSENSLTRVTYKKSGNTLADCSSFRSFGPWSVVHGL